MSKYLIAWTRACEPRSGGTYSVTCGCTVQDRMSGVHVLPLDSLCAHLALHEGLIAEEVAGVAKRLPPKGRTLALEDARKTALGPNLAHRVPGSIVQPRSVGLRLQSCRHATQLPQGKRREEKRRGREGG